MEPSFLALPKKYSKFSARFLKAVIWKKNQTHELLKYWEGETTEEKEMEIEFKIGILIYLKLIFQHFRQKTKDPCPICGLLYLKC